MSIKDVYLVHNRQPIWISLTQTSTHAGNNPISIAQSFKITEMWDKKKKKLNAYINLQVRQKAFKVVITKHLETNKKVRVDLEHVI